MDMLQDRTALGMKLEDEMELPRVKWEKYRHSAKAGIGKATVKFSGRKESAVGANAEYQIVAGEKENIQVILIELRQSIDLLTRCPFISEVTNVGIFPLYMVMGLSNFQGTRTGMKGNSESTAFNLGIHMLLAHSLCAQIAVQILLNTEPPRCPPPPHTQHTYRPEVLPLQE